WVRRAARAADGKPGGWCRAPARAATGEGPERRRGARHLRGPVGRARRATDLRAAALLDREPRRRAAAPPVGARDLRARAVAYVPGRDYEVEARAPRPVV